MLAWLHVPLPTGVGSSGTEATSCLFLDSQCLTQSRIWHAAEFMFVLEEGMSEADRSESRLQTAHPTCVFLALLSRTLGAVLNQPTGRLCLTQASKSASLGPAT